MTKTSCNSRQCFCKKAGSRRWSARAQKPRSRSCSLGGQDDVTMVFADIRLSGAMDGVDLAHELKMRWPHLHIILTSGNAGTRLKAMATSRCPYGRGAGKLVITGASSATVKQRWR